MVGLSGLVLIGRGISDLILWTIKFSLHLLLTREDNENGPDGGRYFSSRQPCIKDVTSNSIAHNVPMLKVSYRGISDTI